MSILEGSAKLYNGHYELRLPWENFPPVLPNNRPVANNARPPEEIHQSLHKVPRVNGEFV